MKQIRLRRAPTGVEARPKYDTLYTNGDDELVIMKPDGTVAPVGGGGASGGATLFGPVSVTFDSLAFDGVTTAAEQGVVDCGELPDGAVVLLAWVQVTEAWNGDAGNSQSASVRVCDEDGGNYADILTGWWLANTSANVPGLYETTTGSAQVWPTFVHNIAGTHLAFAYNANGGSEPSTGAADVYALIATPS